MQWERKTVRFFSRIRIQRRFMLKYTVNFSVLLLHAHNPLKYFSFFLLIYHFLPFNVFVASTTSVCVSIRSSMLQNSSKNLVHSVHCTLHMVLNEWSFYFCKLERGFKIEERQSLRLKTTEKTKNKSNCNRFYDCFHFLWFLLSFYLHFCTELWLMGGKKCSLLVLCSWNEQISGMQ